MWIGKATTPAERKNAMTYAHVSVGFKSIHEQLHHLLEPNRSDQIFKKKCPTRVVETLGTICN